MVHANVKGISHQFYSTSLMVSGLLGTGVKLIYCNVIHFRLPVGVPAPPRGIWDFLPTKTIAFGIYTVSFMPDPKRIGCVLNLDESAFSCRSHRCCLWLIFRPKYLLLMMASVISLTRPSRSRTVNNTAWCCVRHDVAVHLRISLFHLPSMMYTSVCSFVIDKCFKILFKTNPDFREI